MIHFQYMYECVCEHGEKDTEEYLLGFQHSGGMRCGGGTQQKIKKNEETAVPPSHIYDMIQFIIKITLYLCVYLSMYYYIFIYFYFCVYICAQVSQLEEKEINIDNGFQKYDNATSNLYTSFLSKNSQYFHVYHSFPPRDFLGDVTFRYQSYRAFCLALGMDICSEVPGSGPPCVNVFTELDSAAGFFLPVEFCVSLVSFVKCLLLQTQLTLLDERERIKALSGCEFVLQL